MRLFIVHILLLCSLVSSYSQSKSDTLGVVMAFSLTQDFTQRTQIPIDTSLPRFQMFDPALKKYFPSVFTGNPGSHVQSKWFPDHTRSKVVSFFSSLEPYMELPSQALYYRTRKPFTLLTYFTGGPMSTQQQVLQAVHTQNVNPKLNFALRYSLVSSIGQYPNQKAKDNAFAFSTNYISDRYEVKGVVAVNSMSLQENGGIMPDTVPEQGTLTYAPVFLNYASSKYQHIGMMVTQDLHFGKFPWTKSGDTTLRKKDVYFSTLHYTVGYDAFTRTFNVSSLSKLSGFGDTQSDSAYFRHFYDTTAFTHDQVFFRKFFHQLQLELHDSPSAWFRFRGYAGVFNEWMSYPVNEKHRSSYNLGINAALVSSAGKILTWIFSGKYYLAGYNAFDYELKAQMLTSVRKVNFMAEGGRKAVTSDFYFRQYFGNNVRWDFPASGNDPVRQSMTWLQARLEAPLFTLTGDTRWIQNYQYFTDSMPAQDKGSFIVNSLMARACLNVWKLRTITEVALQQSGSTLVNLPAVAIRNTTAFEQILVRNVLIANLGFDVYYFTSYYADGFNPAIGQFFVQRSHKIGNYPFADVFLNFKLKRTRIMLKYEHINAGLLPRTYFTAWHYPMQGAVFTYGISWSFYD